MRIVLSLSPLFLARGRAYKSPFNGRRIYRRIITEIPDDDDDDDVDDCKARKRSTLFLFFFVIVSSDIFYFRKFWSTETL